MTARTHRLALVGLLACLVTAGGARAQEADGVAEPTIVPPALLTEVEPDYPPAAFAADVEADVVLQVDIDDAGGVGAIVPLELVYYTYAPDGRAVEEPRALDTDVYGFVEAAMAAMAGYRFSPALSVDAENPDGVAIPVRVTWRVGFVIRQQEVVVPADGSGDASTAPDGSAPARIEPDGPVTLQGTLLTRGTRVPLAMAYVTVTDVEADPSVAPSMSISAVTDADGRFAFRGLGPGTWRVEVDEVGYFAFSVEEEVVAGQVTEVTYYVERNDYGEYVSTTVEQAPRREVSRRTLTVTEIQRIPGNNNDAIRVVQNLPGVARASFGGGDVIVRGSEATDTGFYLDGLRLPAIYHFGALRAVVPTEFIEEIRFYPGGFPVDYGRATGGVVDVRTRRDMAERTTGHVDINLYDSGAFVRTPIGERAMLELGARRSYVDAVLAAAGGFLPLSFTTAPRYYDYQARLSLELSDAHTLRFVALGSDDKLDFVLDDEDSLQPADRGGIYAATWFHGGAVSLESELNDTLRNDLRVQAQWQAIDVEFGEASYFDLRNRLYAFRDTLTWTPSDVLALRYGLDIEAYPGRIEISAPRPPREGEEPVDFDSSSNLTATESFSLYWPAQFVGAEVQPHERLRILTGVRNEYYRTASRWAFDGRVAVRWDAARRAVMKASVSNHHQAPTFDETSRSFGNPDLRLEHALHYVAGTEVALTDFLSLDVELFWKDLQDLVTRSTEVVERGGELVPEVYDSSGEGRAYGAEVLLRHTLANNFFGWVAYTLSRSERLDPDTGRYRLFDFDQTHVLTVLGTYSLPKNWSVGSRFRLVSGNPTTPIVGAVFDSDTGRYVRDAGPTNSERLPAFHQLDLRVDKRWIRDRRTANLYLDLQNVYNRKNAEDFAYSYDYSERARITGIPIFPALGFRMEW